jgi:hypothetical protein
VKGLVNGKEEFDVTANVVETAGDTRDSQIARPARPVRKPRTGQENESQGQRFFLAKPGAGCIVPELDREFATEPEAIVESLKTGRTYFTVSEWRGVADFSGRKPQLRKELVPRAPKSG